jgi:hypothetical protein
MVQKKWPDIDHCVNKSMKRKCWEMADRQRLLKDRWRSKTDTAKKSQIPKFSLQMYEETGQAVLGFLVYFQCPIIIFRRFPTTDDKVCDVIQNWFTFVHHSISWLCRLYCFDIVWLLRLLDMGELTDTRIQYWV